MPMVFYLVVVAEIRVSALEDRNLNRYILNDRENWHFPQFSGVDLQHTLNMTILEKSFFF